MNGSSSTIDWMNHPLSPIFGISKDRTSQHYVGVSTSFGRIVAVEHRLYAAQATVQHQDGSTSTYRLSFLQAHGVQGARG